jgi:hypothetical protein
MTQAAPQERTAIDAAEECIHHFVLEAPTRRGSAGQCRKCGEQRQFPVEGSKSWAKVNARARMRGNTNSASN